MKIFFLMLIMAISLNVYSQSKSQRLGDFEDKLDELIFQQQLNQIDRMARENEQLRRQNEESQRKNKISSLPSSSCINPDCYSYKRKYYNGSCKLYWKPGYGFIEISKPLDDRRIYELASNDNKVKLELYIDKSISSQGDKTFMDMHWHEMYQMCK